MRLSEYWKRKDLCFLVDQKDIDKRRNSTDRRKFISVDPRSYICADDNTWHVRPIAVSFNDKSVYIVCPFCGEIHNHGNAGIPGFRVAHCCTDSSERSYFIESEIESKIC